MSPHFPKRIMATATTCARDHVSSFGLVVRSGVWVGQFKKPKALRGAQGLCDHRDQHKHGRGDYNQWTNDSGSPKGVLLAAAFNGLKFGLAKKGHLRPPLAKLRYLR
jgi:hypothetical protein